MVLKNEEELEEKLREDIQNCKKDIVFFAGHLPLILDNQGPGNRLINIDEQRWGEFSLYSFEMGVKLLRHAIDIGKNGRIVVVVDDAVELPKKEVNDKLVRRDPNWLKKPKNRLFNNSKLPKEYDHILEDYNLNYDDLITQQRDGDNTVLVSERLLKEAAQEMGYASENECSLAYKGLILNPMFFNGNDDYLISFMPGQCKGNICEGVLDTSIKLDASHIFFPHIEVMGGIVETKHGYITSHNLTPKPISDCFQEKLITYRKDSF